MPIEANNRDVKTYRNKLEKQFFPLKESANPFLGFTSQELLKKNICICIYIYFNVKCTVWTSNVVPEGLGGSPDFLAKSLANPDKIFKKNAKKNFFEDYGNPMKA